MVFLFSLLTSLRSNASKNICSSSFVRTPSQLPSLSLRSEYMLSAIVTHYGPIDLTSSPLASLPNLAADVVRTLLNSPSITLTILAAAPAPDAAPTTNSLKTALYPWLGMFTCVVYTDRACRGASVMPRFLPHS